MRSANCLNLKQCLLWLILAEYDQSFTINEIKKPLCRATWFFLSLLPLLHCCLANAKNSSEHGLANMVSRSNAPDVFRLKCPFGWKAKCVYLAHGNFIHGTNLEQITCHFICIVKYFTHDVVPPISSR